LYRQSINGNKTISTEALSPFLKQKPNRTFLGFTPYVSIYNIGMKFYHPEETDSLAKSVKKDLEELILKHRDPIRLSRKDSIKAGRDKIKLDKKLKSKQKKDSIQFDKDKGELEKKLQKLNLKLSRGNWLMRAPGEAPVVFDSSLMKVTLSNMSYYLHSKGFFQGSVYPQMDTIRKKIKIEYRIKEKKPYIIDSIHYEFPNTTIDSIVRANLADGLIKENERYDEENLTGERDRLTKLMKSNGYYDFTRQYIFAQVDTFQRSGFASVYFTITSPQEGTHQQYTIDKIYFNSDVTVRPGEKRDTSFYRNIYYIYYKDNFAKRIIRNKIRIKSGSLYNQQTVQQTQIQIASMDMYKFVNINFEKNQDTSKKTLTGYIRTSPFSKYQISDEWGVNVGQAFYPGPYGSLTFKNRSIFRGFEIFEATLRYSLVAVLPQKTTETNKPLLMKEFGGTLSLTFPNIFFINELGKFKRYNAKTKITTGYNLVDRPEYTRGTLRSTFNVAWQKSSNQIFNINLIDINIVNSHVKDSTFRQRLDSIPALAVSFKPAIVTSINASYTFTNNQLGVIKKSKYFRPYIELGGIVPNLVSRFITNEPGNHLFDLQYFEFFKVSADVRYYIPTSKKNSFVMRFFAGYGRPYGSSASHGIFALPYDKYFFTGGPNSIRAWKPRRLGPGSYKDPIHGELYEQPGEIIFETNYEWRAHLIKYFEGAFFIDAGNIWTINKEKGSNGEEKRPGSQFKLDTFWQQIAVGTGVGLRLNFTFLILRFDLAYKVWDPAGIGANRFVGKYIFKYPPYNSKYALLNIGIGYPF